MHLVMAVIEYHEILQVMSTCCQNLAQCALCTARYTFISKCAHVFRCPKARRYHYSSLYTVIVRNGTCGRRVGPGGQLFGPGADRDISIKVLTYFGIHHNFVSPVDRQTNCDGSLDNWTVVPHNCHYTRI